MDLLAMVTAAPEVTVLHGRTEIGSVDPLVLTAKTEGARVIALAPEHVRLRWWTFGGARANAVLAAALGAVAPELLDEWSFSNLNVNLCSDATASRLAAAMREARARFGDDLAGVVPEVSEQALKKLKFAELLPPGLALHMLSARGSDYPGAALVGTRDIVPSDLLR